MLRPAKLNLLLQPQQPAERAEKAEKADEIEGAEKLKGQLSRKTEFCKHTDVVDTTPNRKPRES